jgi:hypothetical protein
LLNGEILDCFAWTTPIRSEFQDRMLSLLRIKLEESFESRVSSTGVRDIAFA